MRAADLGWAVRSFPSGPYNAVTDVIGVRVGQVTMVSGEGRLVPGQGPIRTGVTALDFDREFPVQSLSAAVHVINGFGKPVGLEQVRELGVLETPVLLTSTLSVFRCADAVVEYMIGKCPGIGIDRPTVNPVVLECNDGYLNDIQGRHVGREQVMAALESAKGGPVAEGGVGAGTGMVAFGYKGGIGTASRVVEADGLVSTLGVLVLANFGSRQDLRILGQPVELGLQGEDRVGDGSVIVLAVTDAPASSRQLGRIARRAAVGLSRVGGQIDHGSGEFVLAVTTSDSGEIADDGRLFRGLGRAIAEATEEAVLNSMVCAVTSVGRDGHVVYALPVDSVRSLIGERGQRQ